MLDAREQSVGNWMPWGSPAVHSKKRPILERPPRFHRASGCFPPGSHAVPHADGSRGESGAGSWRRHVGCPRRCPCGQRGKRIDAHAWSFRYYGNHHCSVMKIGNNRTVRVVCCNATCRICFDDVESLAMNSPLVGLPRSGRRCCRKPHKSIRPGPGHLDEVADTRSTPGGRGVELWRRSGGTARR